MIDIKALAKQAGARPIHERPKEWALCGKKELEAFAALVLEAAAVECDKRKHAGESGAALASTAIRALKPEQTK